MERLAFKAKVDRMAAMFESLIVDLDRLSTRETFRAVACARILELKSFRLARRDEHRLEFSVPLSWSSWGEILQVEFEDGAIRVRSSCASLQALDWGKNAQNVDAVRRVLALMLRNARG